MIFLAIIVGIIIILLFVLCIYCNDMGETFGSGMFCGWAMTALFIIEIICICKIVSKPYPKAIDVYQGKTTLEYTIRDGVKVDSIVVFKDDIYGKKD